ncbi:MAG: hypothetical protein Q7S24_01225 [bacterium]|nr:hypothetical protein [bacterium]
MNIKKTILWLTAGLVVVLVAYVGYWVGGGNNQNEVEKKELEQNEAVTFENITGGLASSTNENIAQENKLVFDFKPYQVVGDDIDTSTPHQYYSLPKEIAGLIEWGVPTEIDKLGFYYPEQGVRTLDTNSGSTLEATPYFITGSFIYQNKKGAVVFADVGCVDCFGGVPNPSTMFILYDGKIILVEKMMAKNDWSLDGAKEYVVRKSVLVDSNFLVPELTLPKELNVVNVVKGGKTYTLVAGGHDDLVVRTHDVDTAVAFYEHPYLGTVYQSGNRFEIIAQDGRSWYYQFYPKALDSDGNLAVLFNDKKKNIYKYVTRTGCGNNVDPAVIDVASSTLEEVGVGAGQYKIYILKENEKKLRQQYDVMYYPEGETKMSYEKFLADKPIVYFYDDLGRLIELTSVKYAPAAECGKPVIYLYPEKTTKVKVKVALSHWSYSDPEYRDGWEVLAEPNGRLTEVKTGRNYPYLFWEGTGVGEQPKADSGFVVKREMVPEFLSDKLSKLGLNAKESADFKEFWEPRMTRAPYYFVAFYGTSAMDKIAPLTIEPKPNTVIRILMDYRPLNEPITVKEQKLSAPIRRGFTVVEWGGVLGRE